MTTEWTLAAAIAVILALGFNGAPFWAWTLLGAGGLATLGSPSEHIAVWSVFGVLAVVFNLLPIRQALVSYPVLKAFQALQFFPKISETEQVALRAGDVWVEGELFSGKPDFKKLLDQPNPELTAEEKAFLDGPVEELCRMVNDWDIHKNRDLPVEAWDFIKKKGFFGMIIPKKYGGLEFSALAHSEIIAKISTRSIPMSTTVLVPNSLGPAELLNHYGTEEQKNYYLPRLARGEEIPAFALTEPGAGSDAASIQANGVVFKGTDGKLYLKLNWNKRWITLAAISTVLGLAFRLRDPENLLGMGKTDLGITCALIPTRTPGVIADRRHDPLNVPFYNSPTHGKDVVVPVDAIIGGPSNAGKGWGMLMECLAAGRGISLPAQATGGAKFVTRVASAHATVRKQFGLSIGKFEGIQEALARITGFTYILEAARRYTCGAIDGGRKPPVVTAIAKYHFTEMGRKIINDGMDILGGQGISQGPRNLLASGYQAAPIAITVEGANILTRTLIIFGQGALRAHPYAYKEVHAVETNDLKGFDRAFWGHAGHVIRNTFRAVLLSLTRGWLVIPGRGGVTARYYRKLAWSSAQFALLADIAMGGLGGKLKTKGKTTGRFADVLSWMYLATATLKRFESEGRRKEDEPLLHWSLQYAFAQVQAGFDGLYGGLDIPFVGWIFQGPLRGWSALNPIGKMPGDPIDFAVAELIQKNSEQRERLTAGIFLPKATTEALGRLESAFRLTVASEKVFSTVRKAIKTKVLAKKPTGQLYQDALDKGVITAEEFTSIEAAEIARNEAIQVDDFGLQEYLGYASVGAGKAAAQAG